VNAIGRGIGAAGRAIAAPVQKALNPQGAAESKVAQAFQRDARAGNVLDEATIKEAQEAGQPFVAADAGGNAVRDLARTAANLSSEGRQAIEGVTNARYETQGERIGGYVRSLVGGSANATRTREALEEAARKENRVNYRIAYGRGAGPVWDDALAQLAQAPVVQAALADATRKGANRAAAEGFQPITNPFRVDPNKGMVLANPNIKPNIQFWDYVQRDLSDEISKLQRAGANDEARVVTGIRKQLLDHLDTAVPEFGAARRGAAVYFGADSAVEAGQKFVSSNMPMAEARRNIARLKPAERELFAEGYASNLIDKIDKTGDRRDAVNAIFGNPTAREKAELALGRGKAGELEAFLRRETIMNALRGALGNSNTARQLIEASAWSAGGAQMYVTGDYKGIAVATMVSGLTRGNHALNRRVAERVARMLVSDDPEVLRKATNTIARNPRVRGAVRDAENYIVRAASAEGGAEAPPAEGPLMFDMNGSR
jgi:hypothetical protein